MTSSESIPGYVDATPAALDLMIDIMRIDPAVIRALDFSLSAVDVAGQAHTSAVLTTSDSLKLLTSAASHMSSEGFLTRLKGYVGEVRVHDLLEGSSLPESANNPTFDLTDANGVQLQIKTSLNEQYLRAALEEDAARTVVIPQEMAHLTKDYPNARVVEGFSAAEVEQITREDVASLKDLADAGDISLTIAVISLGLTAARYSWQAYVGRRGWAEAARLTGIEGGGRATGALVGASTGFMVGELLAPVTLGLSLPIGIVAGSLVGITGGSSFFRALFRIEEEGLLLLSIVRRYRTSLGCKLEVDWSGLISSLSETHPTMTDELRTRFLKRATEREKQDCGHWSKLIQEIDALPSEKAIALLSAWFLAHPELAESIPELKEAWSHHREMMEAAIVAQNHPAEHIRRAALNKVGEFVTGGVAAIDSILPNVVRKTVSQAASWVSQAYQGVVGAISSASASAGKDASTWVQAQSDVVAKWTRSLWSSGSSATDGPPAAK